MLLFVGLGNPGNKYANNRHNIGFVALDQIADDNGFSPWRNKFQAEVSDGVLNGKKVILLKPQTFMNLSGQSVGEAMRFYKLAPSDITVFHDELDIAPGKCRVKMGGGHAGHNGLRSIHQHIGPDYQRIRLGIGHPGPQRPCGTVCIGRFCQS
jgi:PTH1 family peptidyl-tRNA hydrolase